MGKTIIAALIVLFICLGLFLTMDPNVTTIGNQNVNSTLVAGRITVSISGEVVKPGQYVMNKDDVLQDLIEVAGGVTQHADSQAYRLSCSLEDGGQYYIAPRVESADVCEPSVIVKVNINRADKEELMTIQGIGSSIAEAIIDYRNQNGEFERLEDIMKVSGIGNSTFERIKNYICLS